MSEEPSVSGERAFWDHHFTRLAEVRGRLAYVCGLAQSVPAFALSDDAAAVDKLVERYEEWSNQLRRTVVIGGNGEDFVAMSHNDLRRWLKPHLAVAQELHREFANIVNGLQPTTAPPLPEELPPRTGPDGEPEDEWFSEAMSLGGSIMGEEFTYLQIRTAVFDTMRNHVIAELRAAQALMQSTIDEAEFCFWLNIGYKHDKKRKAAAG